MLLSRLDPDPEKAAQQYEDLRRKLVKFFDWRRAAMPEDLADQALDRLARKIEEGGVRENPSSYAYGIARMLLLEQGKHQARRQAALDELPPPAMPTPEERESPQLECFDECIGTLTADNRKLILEYYHEERTAKIEARRGLAERLQIPLNTLRIRVFRLRESLERCVKGCMDRKIV